MPSGLRILFLVTDIGFILYWSLTAIVAVGLLALPDAWLFADYHNANIIAWNWSFMPLDLLASAIGLSAVHAETHARAWRPFALISMTLTFCADFMALSFWTFQGSFDPAWWAPNAFLIIWPLLWIRRLADPGS